MKWLRLILALLVLAFFAWFAFTFDPASQQFREHYCAPLCGIVFGFVTCYLIGAPVCEWLCRKWNQCVVPDMEADPGMMYSEQGAKMGRLERNCFVLAVFYPALSLVTAVVILKAFYQWWERAKDADFKQFHLWAGGNVISVLTGVAFGLWGQYVSVLVKNAI